MKTRTIIEELTQEDLVNLLCTATYGSTWLSVYAYDREGVGITDEDCLEDTWAKVLLAGKKITCTDHYAESRVWGNNEDFNICEEGEVEYNISLMDIHAGLSKCADGDFNDADKDNTGGYLLSCFNTFKEDDGGLDNPQAEAIMQIILFNELIYG